MPHWQLFLNHHGHHPPSSGMRVGYQLLHLQGHMRRIECGSINGTWPTITRHELNAKTPNSTPLPNTKHPQCSVMVVEPPCDQEANGRDSHSTEHFRQLGHTTPDAWVPDQPFSVRCCISQRANFAPENPSGSARPQELFLQLASPPIQHSIPAAQINLKVLP
jgi:hypothetical protein